LESFFGAMSLTRMFFQAVIMFFPDSIRYYLETEFAEKPGITYYLTRDEFVEPNGVICEKFDQWEKENKGRASKFIKNVKPKSRKSNNPEIRAGNGTARQLPAASVGALLSNGRSRKRGRDV
jgi:hypothetical protein